MQHFLADLTPATAALLIGALVLAFGFEAINGFHDTANAVATVIYTNTLKPWYAVVWSGIWNFVGVVVSSGAVAYSIVALLPVELVHPRRGRRPDSRWSSRCWSRRIVWNFGTWYVGLPGFELAHADRLDRRRRPRRIGLIEASGSA